MLMKTNRITTDFLLIFDSFPAELLYWVLTTGSQGCALLNFLCSKTLFLCPKTFLWQRLLVSYLLCEVGLLKFILSYVCLTTWKGICNMGVKSHEEEHKSGIHIGKIPFEKMSVNAECWWKSPSPPLLAVNPLTPCPACQAQREAQIRLIRCADPWAQHRTAGDPHTANPRQGTPQVPSTFTHPCSMPHSPAPRLQPHQHRHSTERITSRILQGIDFS